MRHFELVRKCKFVFLSNRSFQEVIGTYIHNIMCDNAISKQIRHILSHNFHSVQFIPVMLRAFVATLVRVFYLYATNSLFYGLSFSVFFVFARSSIECFSAYNYYTQGQDNFSCSSSPRNYRTNAYIF